MGLRELIDSWRRILRLAAKPTKEEYIVSLKISLLGLTLVGSIAFIIRYVFITFLFAEELYGG